MSSNVKHSRREKTGRESARLTGFAGTNHAPDGSATLDARRCKGMLLKST